MNRKKKQIVLTGFTGSGKTTFFNKICKTNQPVCSGGKSVTRQTFLKESAYSKGFRVLDTPGFGSKEEKIIHAVGVLNALTEGPVHQILLIVKWDRTCLMQDYIKDMVLKFMRYRHLLTLVVTHWDTVDQQTEVQNKQEIKNLSTGFRINSVIFVSKNDSGQKICEQIDMILDRCEAENIKLTETEFYSSFDLIDLKGELELDLQLSKGEVLAKFRRIKKVIITFIEKMNENNPSIHEIMHYLTLETKNIAENLITNFQIQNNEKFSKLYEELKDPSLAYLVHFELKKEIVTEIETILQLTQSKLKKDKNHFFNFIKACPYCNTIWLKVSGCGGETICGAFPVNDEYFNEYKMPKKYTFTITEQHIEFKQNQEVVDKKQEQILNQELVDKNKTSKISYKKGSSFFHFLFQGLQIQKEQVSNNQYQEPPPQLLKGCGRKIIWDEIPPLSYQYLKTLLDPGVLDYFAKEVPEVELKSQLIQAQISVKQQVEKAKVNQKVINLDN